MDGRDEHAYPHRYRGCGRGRGWISSLYGFSIAIIIARYARYNGNGLANKEMTKILRPRTSSFSYDRSPPHGRERIQLDCFKNVARICQFLQMPGPRTRRSSISGRTSNIYIYSNGGISSRVSLVCPRFLARRSLSDRTDYRPFRLPRSRATRGKIIG